MSRPKAALFVTCLADSFRPEIGFAAARLIAAAGCDIAVPEQTCCGQPAYNAGDPADAAVLAKNTIAALEPYDYVVVPSGSCAGMIRHHYPALLKDDGAWAQRAGALAAKTHELFAFLRLRGFKPDARCERDAAYHDSCSCLREMKSSAEPRALLADVSGLRLHDIPETEVCCGFGGFFAVKYPEISARMADDKLDNAKRTGAGLVIGADLGCLLHLAGRAARRGDALEIRHAAEVLAGLLDTPPIGGKP